MAKKPSTFLNMFSALFAVTFLSAAALGFVYEMTKTPIAQAALAKKINAIKNVVPEFDNDPIADSFKMNSDIGPLVCYPAKHNGVLVATAVQTLTKEGFGGEISIMAGFLPDGTIVNIAVLSQKETPGLGTKMETRAFLDQFINKNPSQFKLKVKKDGGDVDAISAATISSRAFCDAMRRAYTTMQMGGR